MECDLHGATLLVEAAAAEAADRFMAECLQETLNDECFRAELRALAQELGYRFHHYQNVELQFSRGTWIKVKSPWFCRISSPGRKKRGPKPCGHSAKGTHLALDLMGVFGKTAPTLAFRAAKYATLCPSLDIASQLLADEGINIAGSRIKGLLDAFIDLSAEERCTLSSEAGESLAGKRVVICVDGGRLRERRERVGRRPKGYKQQPYSTPWREPRLFTIYTTDERGKVESAMHVDGTVTDEEDEEVACVPFIAELQAYLQILGIGDAASVTLVADGASWIWERVPAMLESLGVRRELITEVMDMTHARQNLHQTLELCTFGIHHSREATCKQAEDLLRQGAIDELRHLLFSLAMPGCKKKLKKKFDTYFERHRDRMQYTKWLGILPCGSGAVESAIRRVINQRIKAPGTFWTLPVARVMIFLRSKLMYGRWNLLVLNWLDCKRALWRGQIPQANLPVLA